MSNKTKKQTNEMLDTQIKRVNSDADLFGNRMESERVGAKDRADTAYKDIYGGYKNFADTGGIPEDEINRLRGFFTQEGVDKYRGIGGASGGGGGGGGFDAPLGMFDESESNYRKFLGGGFLDLAGLRKAGEGYEKFAETGGYSPEDINNIRLRGLSATPAYYDQLAGDVERSNLAAGGNVANTASAITRLNRQKARQLSEDNINTELGISSAVRGGKLSGLKGMVDTYVPMNQLLLESAEFGTSGLAQIAAQKASLEAQARAAGAAGRQIEAQWLLANAAEMERYINDSVTGGKLAGLGGLADLYKSRPGEVSMYDENILANRSLQGQLFGDATRNRIANNAGSKWKDVFSGLSAGAGAIAPYLKYFGGGGGGGTQDVGIYGRPTEFNAFNSGVGPDGTYPR